MEYCNQQIKKSSYIDPGFRKQGSYFYIWEEICCMNDEHKIIQGAMGLSVFILRHVKLGGQHVLLQAVALTF